MVHWGGGEGRGRQEQEISQGSQSFMEMKTSAEDKVIANVSVSEAKLEMEEVEDNALDLEDISDKVEELEEEQEDIIAKVHRVNSWNEVTSTKQPLLLPCAGVQGAGGVAGGGGAGAGGGPHLPPGRLLVPLLHQEGADHSRHLLQGGGHRSPRPEGREQGVRKLVLT